MRWVQGVGFMLLRGFFGDGFRTWFCCFSNYGASQLDGLLRVLGAPWGLADCQSVGFGCVWVLGL